MTDHRKQQNDAGFEHKDLGSKPVYGFLVSLVVIGILIYYAMWGLFDLLDVYNRRHERQPSPMMQVEQETREPDTLNTHQKIEREFPQPRLEDDERTELAPFRYKEEQILNSYGWVDQSAGVVRIPIQRAMELIVQRGLPTTPQTGTVPPSTVNMAKEAAAKADVSNLPAKPAGKGKKK